MKLLKYLTIESTETFEQALSKIRREIKEDYFYVSESPQNLMGNHKILKLVSKRNFEDMIKIDGPGFIIDQLFNYFIKA